jgi:hypothetical protein
MKATRGVSLSRVLPATPLKRFQRKWNQKKFLEVNEWNTVKAQQVIMSNFGFLEELTAVKTANPKM